jgi:hypothetical protein
LRRVSKAFGDHADLSVESHNRYPSLAFLALDFEARSFNDAFGTLNGEHVTDA